MLSRALYVKECFPFFASYIPKKFPDPISVFIPSPIASTLPCIIKATRLNKELAELGFTSVPEGVRNILNHYGFAFDYTVNGWVRRFTGIAKHIAHIKQDGTTIQDDVYSEDYGYNVALTVAKYKSQCVARSIMEELAGVFYAAATLFNNSAEHFNDICIAEADAYDRVVATGYCDPVV